MRIPLSYAFHSDLQTKLPITISFLHSNILSVSPTPQLYLLGLNLSAPVKYFPTAQTTNHVEIGLGYPSDFISAVSSMFGIQY